MFVTDWLIDAEESGRCIFNSDNLDSNALKEAEHRLAEKKKALGFLSMKDMTILVARFVSAHYFLIRITITSSTSLVEVYDSLDPGRRLDEECMDKLHR